MMRGMKPSEYMEVMAFVQDKLSLLSKDRPKDVGSIKYVNTVYDTRFGEWWSITFRGWFGGNVNLRSNYNNSIIQEQGKAVPFESLYEWCMAFLKGEWKPTEEFYEEI